MNKNLLIGVGVLAVVGVGAFFLLKKREKSTEAGGLDLESETLGGGATAQSTAAATAAAEAAAAETEAPLDETLSPTTPLTRKEARQERRGTRKEERQVRKQTRRDCKDEAKSKGLKRLSKERRNFMKDCKAAGGVNADFAGEEADFAFNGYSCFN